MSKVSSQPRLDEMSFRVVKELGSGAGSTIFLIGDNATGKKYALKMVKRLSPDDDIYVAQAKLEYEVAQKFHHESIVKIFDCRLKRKLFRVNSVELLMEYVDGRTLDEAPFPDMKQLVLIFIHVAAALVHMHRRGVYHGDLKPSNIMYTKDGQVKVIDFGTAWIKGQEKGRVQGTPQYMAPEQAVDKIANERTDMYNFGATMYRMFTGRYVNTGGIPRVGDRGVEETRIMMKPPSEHNPKIPKPLNDTILACVELSPDRRPAGMFELMQKLRAIARAMKIDEAALKTQDDES